MAEAVLRPMTLGELLDRTFVLYRRHFPLFAAIVALPNLAMLAFQLANVSLRQPTFSLSLTFVVTMLATMMVSLIVYLSALAVAQGATVVAVSRLHLGRSVTVAEAFRAIKSRVVTLWLTTLVIAVAVIFGALLLIVPGMLLALMWSLALPVVVLERRGVRASISRSSFVTKVSGGRSFASNVLFILLAYILYSLWQVPLIVGMTLYAPDRMLRSMPVWAGIVFAIGSFATQCVAGPLLTIALSLVYYDQRVRKEAFDLEHMMSQLDGTAAV